MQTIMCRMDKQQVLLYSTEKYIQYPMTGASQVVRVVKSLPANAGGYKRRLEKNIKENVYMYN